MAIKHRKTLGNILLLEVDANPNGLISAPKGSVAYDSYNGATYISGGSTQWNLTAMTPPVAVNDLRLWLTGDGFDTANGKWPDQSIITAPNPVFTVGSGGTAPTQFTNVLNGKSVVRFSGNNRLVSGALSPFLVTDADSNNAFAFWVIKSASSAYMYLSSQDNGLADWHVGQVDTDSLWLGETPVNAGWTSGTWKIVTIHHGGSGSVWINGTQQVTGVDTRSGGNLTSLVVGGRGFDDASSHWDGDIAEMLLYAGNIGETNRGLVEAYLNAKYAIY